MDKREVVHDCPTCDCPPVCPCCGSTQPCACTTPCVDGMDECVAHCCTTGCTWLREAVDDYLGAVR